MSKQRLFTPALILAALASLSLGIAGFSFVHLPGFLQQLGAGEAEIGGIMATTTIGMLLVWPITGRVIDRHGRRIVILSGGALFCLAIALHLYIRSIGPYVYVLRLLDGAAHGMWYTALFTYAADLVPAQRRTQGLAIFGISGVITIGLGAQFGDAVLAYASYRELFIGALLFSALGLVFSLPLRDVPHPHTDTAESARGLLAVATQSNLRPVWVAAIVFFVSLGTLFTFTKTYVAAAGVGNVSTFFTAYAAVAVFLRIFFGWLPDRIHPKRMLGVALFCYALGFVALSLAQAPWHVVVAGILCGAGHGYTYPVLFSLVVERAKPRERGTAMAIYTALDGVGLLIAGPLSGYVIERAGYGYAFASLAVVLIAGVAVFYSIDQHTMPARAAKRAEGR